MGQLPQLISETANLRQRSDFEVLTVAFDNPDRMKEVDKTIRDFKIKHHVIWDPVESGSLSNKADWNIQGFPTTLLINPAGVIQTSMDVDENLAENLNFFFEHGNEVPVIGLSITPKVDADGKAIVENGKAIVTVDVYSPTHEPLQVKVDVNAGSMTYDEEADPEHENPEHESVDYREEGMAPDFEANFDEFGNYSTDIALDVSEHMVYCFVSVSVSIPGTEHLNGGEGLSTSGFDFISFNRE